MRFERLSPFVSVVLIVAFIVTGATPSFALRGSQPERKEQRAGLEEALKDPDAVLKGISRFIRRWTASEPLPSPAAGLEEGSAATFVAVTVPSLLVPDDMRTRMDRQVRGAIGAAFGKERGALEFGPGTTPLDQQTKDGGLRGRGEEAYQFLFAAAQARSPELADTLRQHRLVLIASDDDPALLHTDAGAQVTDEERAAFHLIGSSGNFDWQGTTQSPASHYAKLALIEDARAALKDEGARNFLGAWATHEVEVLSYGGYVAPAEVDAPILNDGYARIRDFRYQRRLAQVEKARERQLKQTILEFANIRLGQHIVASGIPQESVEAAKAVLTVAKERGEIEGFRVLAAADDLVVQVNHRHGPQSPLAGRLMVAVGTAALKAAEAKKILKESGQQVLTSPYTDRSKKLGIRRGAMPMTERVADPLLVAHAINGGAGTFNRAIWRALISLDTHPSARIAGDTFRSVVEAIDDVRQGKKDRARYTFGPGQMKELLALIGDHSEYMITEVYAETGRFAQSNPGEPVVKVIVEPVDAEGFTGAPANPTMVVRIQSGSEALGVFTDALGNPWVAPGGANDAYHLTTIPVSWEQANQAPQRGYINLVAYEYTSYGDGRVPLDRDIIDPFNPVARPDAGLLAKLWGSRTPELQVTFQLAQERAHRIANFMMGHGEMDPFLTARGAEALSERTAKLVEEYWRPLPKVELSLEEGGEVDPVVAIANTASNGRTLSLIKADAGGEGAHLIPPAYFSLAAEATQDIMLEDRLIQSGEHFAVGDDNQQLSIHRRGMDNHEIHMGNYRIFWRMVYLAANYELVKSQVKARDEQGVAEQVKKIFPAKIYQAGQDLVSEAVRGKPVPQLAEVDDRSVTRMAQLLRRVGRENQAEALEYGYAIYKADLSAAATVAVNPFSGTITGQGPGFAEIPLRAKGPTRVAAIFTDKDGPASFNVPTVWVLENALARGIIRKRGGAIAEIYDTKAQKHIFLDVETQMDVIRGLAANADRYNFKRVVSKRKSGWDPANPLEYIGDRWFISLSTEKLSIITGGEYRGKDDSVLLASMDEDEDFGQLYFEFDARYSYFTQGDGFGSHDTTIRPELLPTAIATMQSRGVKSAFRIDVNEDDQMAFTEVYTDPAFRARRREGEEITRLLWDVNGSEFTPVGVGWRRVERSYPLAKMIVGITGIDWDLLADTTTDATVVSVDEVVKKSPFAVRAHVDAAQSVAQGQLVEQFPSVNQQISAKVARAAHDTRNPKTVLLHESFFTQGPEGAIAVQRTLGGLGFTSPDEAATKSAVKFVVSSDLQFDLSERIQALNAASGGAVQLKPEWFTVTTGIPDHVDVAIGPSSWVNATLLPMDAEIPQPVFGDQVVKVAYDAPLAGETASAASAFHRGIEAIAATPASGLEQLSSDQIAEVARNVEGFAQEFRMDVPEGARIILFVTQSKPNRSNRIVNDVLPRLAAEIGSPLPYYYIPYVISDGSVSHYRRVIQAIKQGLLLEKNRPVVAAFVGSPFKREGADLSDGRSPTVPDAGAAELFVRRQDGQLWSTAVGAEAIADWFKNSYRRSLQGLRIVVLGVGGVGSSFVEVAKREGAGEVTIADPDSKKVAEVLRRHSTGGFQLFAVAPDDPGRGSASPQLHRKISEADWVLSATRDGRVDSAGPASPLVDTQEVPLRFRSEAVVTELNSPVRKGNILDQAEQVAPTTRRADGFEIVSYSLTKMLSALLKEHAGIPVEENRLLPIVLEAASHYERLAAGLEEMQKKLAELDAFGPWVNVPELRPTLKARPILIDASGDFKVGFLALALSISMQKSPIPELEFRLVIQQDRVDFLVKQLAQVNRQAAEEFLQPRIISYDGETTDRWEARLDALRALREHFGFDSVVQMRDSGLLIVEELTPDLKLLSDLRGFFEAGGLNFVSQEALDRLRRLFEAA